MDKALVPGSFDFKKTILDEEKKYELGLNKDF